MSEAFRSLGLPRWSPTRWLVDPVRDVPAPVRAALFNSLYGSIPIFLGGVFNTLFVSILVATRHPQPVFIGWAVAELVLAVIRLPVLILGRRAVRRGTPGPSDLYILLAVFWAASVGFGAFICMMSGDWVAATLACLSAAAMVGGICFRNYAAPRLVAVMIFLSLGPCMLAGILSREPILLVIVFQIPMYLFSMSRAAFGMNRMLVERMLAEIEKDRRSRHDSLTDLLNRAGLAEELHRRSVEGRLDDLAYFFLDLDGFKRVNDTLGHAAGDRLLAQVAGRLRASAGPDDIAVRLGGDEFLVLHRCAGRGAADAYATVLIRALSEKPYIVGDHGIEVGVCIGVALSREHGTTFQRLIEAADAALYHAKARGRCCHAIAAPGATVPPGRARQTPAIETRAAA